MKFYVAVLCIVAVAAAGCSLFEDEKEVQGTLTAVLPAPEIKSGESAKLVVEGANTGSKELTVAFVIVPQNPESVTVTYPRDLEFAILPEETTGKKVLTVTAITEAQRSDYGIDIFLRDVESGEDIARQAVVLTVRK